MEPIAVQWRRVSEPLWCCPLQRDCARRKKALKRRHRPSLFQHVGLHSSLAGKLQRLKASDCHWLLCCILITVVNPL